MRPSTNPRRRHANRLTAFLAVMITVSAMAVTTASVESSPLSLGRPNPEGTSI